jgi:O-acetyl-ADP-ribose deacetylase (regulator of RNase III)
MSIHYLQGDATQPIGDGNKAIIHVCNDIGAWGAGFVLALSKNWSQPEAQYRAWAKTKNNFQLGFVQPVKVAPNITVINMIGQSGIRSVGNMIPLRYDALEICLTKVANYCKRNNMSVHMPRIGCGLAGGDWNKVEEIINQTLIAENLDVFVYDFD